MKKILIVDDDINIGNMLEEVLTAEGYAVLRAYSGTEAVMLLASQTPDLVLLDLMLPGLSGEEVLPKIKGIPVIILSAKIGIEDKVSLLLGGAADYITKPFDIKELLARISVQLRKSEYNNENEKLNFDEISLDTASHSVYVCEKELRLTRTEYAILK
ncbi:MAG: response regulator transcription factor, partial [Eubacterium sp.]|nr:response regulator transcription factor [Eubacterium sp.]